MAYVNPSMRMAPRAVYMPRSRALTNGAPTATPSDPTSDFQTILKKQSASAPAAPAAATAPNLAGTPGTIGTVTPGPTAPSVPAPVAKPAAMAPSAQSLFGPNPWVSDPGGKGPNGAYSYNKYYFATPATAAKVAQMMGGTVVTKDDITSGGPFVQNQPNQMVKMPDGHLVNAGLIASYFDHGWSQQAVDSLVNGEMANVPT